jgi:hypothetical protein
MFKLIFSLILTAFYLKLISSQCWRSCSFLLGRCLVLHTWTNFLKYFGTVWNQSIEVIAWKFVKMCSVTITALMVSARKQLFSSVPRAFVIENTLVYSCTSTRNGKREFQKSCVFFNEIHSLCTNSNISDHLSRVVSDFVFDSSILVLLIFATWTNSYM